MSRHLASWGRVHGRENMFIFTPVFSQIYTYFYTPTHVLTHITLSYYTHSLSYTATDTLFPHTPALWHTPTLAHHSVHVHSQTHSHTHVFPRYRQNCAHTHTHTHFSVICTHTYIHTFTHTPSHMSSQAHTHFPPHTPSPVLCGLWLSPGLLFPPSLGLGLGPPISFLPPNGKYTLLSSSECKRSTGGKWQINLTSIKVNI